MPTRRAFLVSGATAVLAGRALDATAARPRPPLARGGAFPQGVMAGQPASHAATLWAQLAEPERPGPLRLEVATDPGFARVVHRERVTPAPHTGIARRRVVGLRPARPYWYRFAGASGSSPVGRFRTLPPPDSADPVRIGVWSCQMYFLGYFTGQAALAAEDDLDLVLCLGDYIYETYLDLTRTEPRPEGAEGGAQTLAEYRAKYAAYRSDPDLRAMHAAHAFLPLWDDHEVANDYGGSNVPAGEREPDPAKRRRHAYRAWFEAMPLVRSRREPDRTYRRLRIGRHLDLFALDTRQYRVEGQTLLGPAQEAWLTKGLTTSRASWKVLGSSVLMMDLNGPGSESITGASAGSWQAFADRRRALGERLVGGGVRDVAAVTGDAHAFYAGTVTTEGDASGTPFATEFCAGTMAASNAGTSVFEGLGPASAPALSAADRVNTPTLAFSNAADHGYAIVEARADALDVTFRAVETIQQPKAAVRDLARFTVARGEIGPHAR
ncbi:MAG: alkaline phosphatase D family protein [Solirubrobacteraceae bacterium]